MNYEISTVRQLKAAVIDALDTNIVMNQSCLRSYETFETAVGEYIDMFLEAEAIDPTAADAAAGEDWVEWYEDLKALYAPVLGGALN